MVEPLDRITEKKSFKWDVKQHLAFEEIKNASSCQPNFRRAMYQS